MGIGVFDSGVGGLTVLRALRETLPTRQFIYLGDTARLPYGTKSAASVVRYAGKAAELLVERDLDCLVVACNTATAMALPILRERYAPLPVIGVVEPGAEAAVVASATGHIAVIATEGTVRSGAYGRAIRARRPDARISPVACSVFVALAEEGWTDGMVVEFAVRRYLEPLLQAAVVPDVLLLGCTHFPVLSGAIRRVVGPGMSIVDSAGTTAAAVAAIAEVREAPLRAGRGGLTLLATDDGQRFARVGSRFLGEAIDPAMVEIVDLG